MFASGSKPLIGSSNKTLGIRSPTDAAPGVEPDIAPDATGRVHPGTGGMSVGPRLVDLPAFLVPRRLKMVVPRAAGSAKLMVWAMGSGSFAPGPIAPGLVLRLDPARPTKHGFVEPDRIMTLEEYRQAIEATQNLWALDEVIP
jgi:hypothetical protein